MNVQNAALQIFTDDIQAHSYQVTINSKRVPSLEAIINALDQGGPIGKLITFQIPPELLPDVASGHLELKFDDTLTGAGDGYAVDFVKLLVNRTAIAQTGAVSGRITDVATGAPLPGAVITSFSSQATTSATGEYTLTNVPAGYALIQVSAPGHGSRSRLTDVIAGQTSTNIDFALIRVGTVVAWGLNDFGQTNVPAGLSGVMAIAAGGRHTVALKSDGTVVAWGLNDFGQTNVPAGLSGVTAIAAGLYHTVALKGDGTVVAWGAGEAGQSSFPQYGQASVPAGLSGVTAIAAGGYHTIALKSDSTVVAWGLDLEGQTTGSLFLSGVMAIAAGDSHTVALKSDGTVVAWGRNVEGQASVPAGLSGVMSIAVGGFHCVAQRNDSSVVVWGSNGEGQTAVPAGLNGVTAFAAGGYHTVALKSDGTVTAWGRNVEGQTNVPAGLSGVIAIAAGANHTVAIVAEVPPQITIPPPASVTNFAGSTAQFGVTATGTAPLAYRWFFGNTSVLNATNRNLSLTNVQPAQAGNYRVVITNIAGAVTSSVVALTVVLQPPSLLTQPTGESYTLGSSYTLSVSAGGTAPLSYQW